MLWPGDFAIWIRHDDVVHFQKKHHAACVTGGGSNCKTQTNPCELIRYQSLDNTGTEGGHGLTGLTHAQKDANDHDADGLDNDQHKDPKCADTHNSTTLPSFLHLFTSLSLLCSAYVYYNGTVEPNPPTDYKAVRIRPASHGRHTFCLQVVISSPRFALRRSMTTGRGSRGALL